VITFIQIDRHFFLFFSLLHRKRSGVLKELGSLRAAYILEELSLGGGG
jgi:hypothetical protein